MIGNSQASSTLARTRAQALASTLKRLDFQVITRSDADLAELQRGLTEFRAALSPGCVGMVVFVGEGAQVGGVNWLLASKAPIASADDVPAHGLKAAALLEAMSQAAVKIVVLDAAQPEAGGALTAKGLAFMKGPPGSFIAYAQSPGQANASGGRYIDALNLSMKYLGRPVEEMFKKAAALVSESSGRTQTPWTSSALQHNVRFSDPGKEEGPISTDSQLCRDEFLTAQSFMRQGNQRQAAKHLKRVVKLCPAHRAGKQAQRYLLQLER